jgi:predicted deacylase
MLTTDKINCSLDFERDGKHFGNLELSFSDNEHAFAKIPVPIVSIKNGSGRTLLLSAGNHGDEYEWQVILRRLIHELSAEDINGRLILLPALNYPAMLDNARVCRWSMPASTCIRVDRPPITCPRCFSAPPTIPT